MHLVNLLQLASINHTLSIRIWFLEFASTAKDQTDFVRRVNLTSKHARLCEHSIVVLWAIDDWLPSVSLLKSDCVRGRSISS